MEINPGSTGTFNQAGYQQMRIHELFSRVDLFSSALFEFNGEWNDWNYNLAFKELNTILLTISSKLSEPEQEKVFEQRKDLRNTMRTKPVRQKIYSEGFGKTRSCLVEKYKNQDDISDKLFLFRLEIERLMDSHGLSNPSKQNPTKAAIN